MYIAPEIEGVTYSCKLIYTYLQNSAQIQRRTLASHHALPSTIATRRSTMQQFPRASTSGIKRPMDGSGQL